MMMVNAHFASPDPLFAYYVSAGNFIQTESSDGRVNAILVSSHNRKQIKRAGICTPALLSQSSDRD